MEDKTLLNISLAVSSLGIVLLLLLSFYDKIPEVDFNELGCEDTGKYVKVRGTIDNIVVRNTSTSIRLEQKCYQDIFIFDNYTTLANGDTLVVQVTIKEYHGKLSILADKISQVD